MKLRDLYNLYKLKPETIPEGSSFFRGVIIGGFISLLIWIVILKAIF
jgi:hypothetical protein